MTFSQFMSVLRARRWIVLLVLGLTVITALVVSLLLPKQYKAVASVVVDFKPDPISAFAYGGALSPAVMATQADIIQSDRVALRAVRNLKLAESPQVKQQWQDETGGEGSVEQWLITALQKQLDVIPSRESNVISISYKAADPRFAAALANAFMQAYIQTALELRVDPARQYSTFFDTRAKEAREAYERAQARLSAFQKEKGIIASDERLDVENARLNELSSQVVALQALSAESGSRQTQANSAQGDKMQEVLNNPLIGSMKADISRGEARLKELNTRYGEAHPQVQETMANLAELRSRLDVEIRKLTSGVTVTNTINRQRESQIRAELESQRAKVLRLKAVRDEGEVLQRDLDNAQKTLEQVQLRFTQTSLESQTTQSNINVLSEAVPPTDVSSPKIILNTVLAIFLGGLLAIATAMLLEVRDRRVRSVDDVLSALDLPVIGVMPKPGSKGLLGRNRASTMQRRLLAPLPSPSKGV